MPESALDQAARKQLKKVCRVVEEVRLPSKSLEGWRSSLPSIICADASKVNAMEEAPTEGGPISVPAGFGLSGFGA